MNVIGRDQSGPTAGYLAFYRDAYASAIREVRVAGHLDAALFTTEQTAGDWSDAATPDLVLSMVRRHAYEAVFDLGAGRRHAVARPGDFCLVPPHVATTFLADGRHSLRLLAMPYQRLLRFAGPDCGLPQDGDFGRLHTGACRDEPISILLEQLWVEAANGTPNGALCADGLLLQVAGRLLKLARQAERPARGRLSPAALRRVQEAIADRLDADLALDQLAAIAGLSAFHFARAFKADTGVPPHRYLVARRMEHARELLRTTKLPIIEIAARVGYGDPAHFAKLFRREVGAAPARYRAEQRS